MSLYRWEFQSLSLVVTCKLVSFVIQKKLNSASSRALCAQGRNYLTSKVRTLRSEVLCLLSSHPLAQFVVVKHPKFHLDWMLSFKWIKNRNCKLNCLLFQDEGEFQWNLHEIYSNCHWKRFVGQPLSTDQQIGRILITSRGFLVVGRCVVP